MLPHHIHRRFQWSSEKITWTMIDWNIVVHTDEKNFSLDGPDGFAYYWHHISREERKFSKIRGEVDLLWYERLFLAQRSLTWQL